MDKALKWMNTADNITYRKYKNRRSVIVKIDIELIKRKYPNVANSAYDLSNSNNRNHFLKTSKQKSFACAYSEIVFERHIPSEAVSVVYTTKDGYVNNENKKPCVTRPISNEAVIPRTKQSVHLPNDSSDQLRRAAEYNLRKSSNSEAKSLKSYFHSNQVSEFEYLGYGNVSEYEKGYQPSKASLSSQASRTRQKSDLNSTTFETKKASYERSYPPYKLEVPSQEGRKRDKPRVNSTNFKTENSSRPSIPTRSLRPSLSKDLSEPRDYSSYEGSHQPRKFEVSGRRDRAHDRTRQSSDFETSGYSRPSLRTNRSSPEVTSDAPRNKPLWKRILSFLSCPFSRVNNQR